MVAPDYLPGSTSGRTGLVSNLRVCSCSRCLPGSACTAVVYLANFDRVSFRCESAEGLGRAGLAAGSSRVGLMPCSVSQLPLQSLRTATRLLPLYQCLRYLLVTGKILADRQP